MNQSQKNRIKFDWAINNVPLHSTMDARVWTQCWLETIKNYPDIPEDEGTMVGWFANAIMAGYDRAFIELNEENNKLKKRIEELENEGEK